MFEIETAIVRIISSFTPTASKDLTAQDFMKTVKRDKTSHYRDLMEDKYFNSLNCGFVAMALQTLWEEPSSKTLLNMDNDFEHVLSNNPG